MGITIEPRSGSCRTREHCRTRQGRLGHPGEYDRDPKAAERASFSCYGTPMQGHNRSRCREAQAGPALRALALSLR